LIPLILATALKTGLTLSRQERREIERIVKL
jgi:hypothetical protein